MTSIAQNLLQILAGAIPFSQKNTSFEKFKLNVSDVKVQFFFINIIRNIAVSYKMLP